MTGVCDCDGVAHRCGDGPGCQRTRLGCLLTDLLAGVESEPGDDELGRAVLAAWADQVAARLVDLRPLFRTIPLG